VTARSLIIQTSFLGDTVLTTPLIAELAERGSVDVVVTPASAALLAHNPAIENVIVYDKRGRDRGVGGFVRMVRRLRANRYATAYMAQASVRSGALVAAAGIPERVGYETSAGRRFYTRRVPYIENEHHAARLLRLAGVDADASRLRPRLYPGHEERAAVDGLLRDAGAADEELIALAPGSVWATKRWPYYAELAGELDARVVIIGAAADRALADAIMQRAGAHTIDATGKLSLLASAELISR